MQVKNGIFKGSLKVKGGKYIKCTLIIENRIIKSITFTGDFFMHPEEKIKDLEEILVGNKVDIVTLEIILKKFFETVYVIGATEKDFLDIITIAINN